MNTWIEREIAGDRLTSSAENNSFDHFAGFGLDVG